MLIPSYSAIIAEFNIEEAIIAIPDALFVLISAFFALIWGYYADKFNRTTILFAGAVSWTIGMILTGISPNLQILITSRMLSGAGLGCVLPIGYSIISDAIPPDERSGWFGILAILSAISNAIGQGLSGFLGPIFDWRFPFFLLSAISVVIIILLLFIKLPYRGTSEAELMELSDLNLEYSFRISKKDLKQIIGKKTNLYLIIQGFFSIIPGTILIYFIQSILITYYFYDIPAAISGQTAAVFAALIGIGYLIGNIVLSQLGDVLYRRNRKNRVRLSTICMLLAIPTGLLMLYLLVPVDITKLDIVYPEPFPKSETFSYLFKTIGQIFTKYPQFIYFFVFAFLASFLSAGPVANRNAVMIDVNLPEHKGTAASFFNLSEQIGKGITLLLSFMLISFLGNMFITLEFSIFFWLPAGILWFFAGKNVTKDMDKKSQILQERKQITLIDYIFELDIQMDRAIQKIQDAKYYIRNDKEKFLKLIDDGIRILKFCEREGEFRSMTNITNKACDLGEKASAIKDSTKIIYKNLDQRDLTETEKDNLYKDLEQIKLKIGILEKSTFGTIQTYYEDAYIKIIEATLMRRADLLKSLSKIYDAIRIYDRVRQLLSERIDNVHSKADLSDEDSFIYEKELELYKKTKKALWATQNLRDQFEGILNHLEEHGIKRQNLEKISDLTSEYNVNFYQIILDTFDYDKETKEKLLSEISYIDKIFLEFDKIYELKELNVF
ncbi:MAG: MFS transporter [Candidatus Lokiarchaeota archaeon]|nr:MFS transporter [Candidatus Lokiarchaeota archaeon]